jgi:MoaD family protein
MVDGVTAINCTGGTLADALTDLQRTYPALGSRILDRDGKIDKGLFILLNKRNVRDLDGLNTPVREGDEIKVLPIAAGG